MEVASTLCFLLSFDFISVFSYDYQGEWPSPHPPPKEKKHGGGHLPITFEPMMGVEATSPLYVFTFLGYYLILK